MVQTALFVVSSKKASLHLEQKCGRCTAPAGLERVSMLGCNLGKEMSLRREAYFIYCFIYCICQVNGVPNYEDAKHNVGIYQH